MTKLQRAKRQARKKWRGMLRDLPGMTKGDFIDRAIDGCDCGFCSEYPRDEWPTEKTCRQVCPANAACNILSSRRIRIEQFRYWRKPAADLCRWALREIDKVKEES